MIKVGTLVKCKGRPPAHVRANRGGTFPSFGVAIRSSVLGWEVRWIDGTTTTQQMCYLKEVSRGNL